MQTEKALDWSLARWMCEILTLQLLRTVTNYDLKARTTALILSLKCLK